MDVALDKQLEDFKRARGRRKLVLTRTTAAERSAVHKWVETNPSAAVREWEHRSRTVGGDRQLHLIKPCSEVAQDGNKTQVNNAKAAVSSSPAEPQPPNQAIRADLLGQSNAQPGVLPSA